jgi:hypothetical protein
VVRAYDAEVAAIEGRNLGDAVPFGRRNHRRIYGSKRQVVVAGHELRHPEEVRRVYRLEREVACRQVTEETHLRLPAKASGKQVGNLGDDQARDDQRARMRLEKLKTYRMVGIVGIDVGVQRARVDD